MDSELDAIADALYAMPPEDFVPAREDQVSAARERGDRDLARAIGRLRRPTRPAWLANLLARHRAEQLDNLITLADGLAQAQRTLDGAQLRALSSQRNRAVAAMAREAGRLAQEAGSPATDAQLRELHGILEAALAQPEVAREVRVGRLTRTLSYTGFGPETDADAVPVPAPRPAPDSPAAPDAQHREVELGARRRAVAEAEQEADTARAQEQRDEATRDEARDRHSAVRQRVAALAVELEAAREEERQAGDTERAAAAALRDSARAARAAAADLERARARLDELA